MQNEISVLKMCTIWQILGQNKSIIILTGSFKAWPITSSIFNANFLLSINTSFMTGLKSGTSISGKTYNVEVDACKCKLYRVKLTQSGSEQILKASFKSPGFDGSIL